jgi:hypothetical protein
MAQGVECLPNIQEVLSSNPNTAKKKKKKVSLQQGFLAPQGIGA